jgi:hypothetical protein
VASGRARGPLGRRADALKLHEEALALRTAKLGRGHPQTLLSMTNLAVADTALGQHAEALALRQVALEHQKAKIGPNHPDTLDSMWGVAASLMRLDRGAEAVPIIDEYVRRAAGRVVDPRLVPAMIGLRLRHFEKAKDASGCRATAELWEKLGRADAGSLYNAACLRAVTAKVLRATDTPPGAADQTAGEADRAMAWLTQAVAAGSTDRATMERDKENWMPITNRWLLGPSKFVGYVGNTRDKYEEAGEPRRITGRSNPRFRGGATDKAITRVLGKKCEHDELEHAYKNLCKVNKVKPANRRRTYWIMPPGMERDMGCG